MAIPSTIQLGFFAIVDFSSKSKTVLDVGYVTPGTAKKWMHSILNTPPPYTGKMVVEPNPTLIWPSGNPANPPIRSVFEAFLQTLYGVNASLTSDSRKHDLHSQMVAGGVDSQYGEVEIVDFMAFTGAIDRQQTLPDGTVIDCLNIAEGAPRPLVSALRKKPDFSTMYQIIEHLGIEGMYPSLYAREGITFAQFTDRIHAWIPDQPTREAYVYNTLIPLLRNQALKAPVLTEAMINQLIQ